MKESFSYFCGIWCSTQKSQLNFNRVLVTSSREITVFGLWISQITFGICVQFWESYLELCRSWNCPKESSLNGKACIIMFETLDMPQRLGWFFALSFHLKKKPLLIVQIHRANQRTYLQVCAWVYGNLLCNQVSCNFL